MRKFFELAVVSRKSVKGETLFTAEAKSKAGEIQGKASVVMQKEGAKGGIYFRYVPAEGADANKTIQRIELKAEDQAKVTEVLKQLRSQIVESVTKDSKTEVEKFLVSTMVSAHINAEEGTIKVPEDFGVTITNEMISEYWNIVMENDEWIGIEVKFEQKIAEEISRQAEEKHRQQRVAEEAAKRMAELFGKSGYGATGFKSENESKQEDEEDEEDDEVVRQLEELESDLDELLRRISDFE